MTVAAVLTLWNLPRAWAFLPDAPMQFWYLAVLALLVDLPLFTRVRPQAAFRTTLTVCFAMAVILDWGVGPGIIVQAVAAAVSAIGQRSSWRTGLGFVSRLVLALLAAQVVLTFVLSQVHYDPRIGRARDALIPFLIMASVWLVTTLGLIVLWELLVSGIPPRPVVARVFDGLFATVASMLLAQPLLSIVSDWRVSLVALPLIMWNLIVGAHARREQRLNRDPVSGAMSQRGLMAALEDLVRYDFMKPYAPRSFGLIVVSGQRVPAISRVLGRHVYETVVKELVRRLVAAYGAIHVGRLAGEGLVVVVPDLTAESGLAEAERAVEVCKVPIEVNGVPFDIEPTAGVALSPLHGRDLGVLLVKAELALTDARRRGVAAGVHAPVESSAADRRMALLVEMAAVLRDPGRADEIAVHYQPQIELQTGRLRGVEALLRWTHPQWGPVPTDELIEAIEPSDVMHLLTLHMLERVTEQIRAWNERGFALRVAINVSANDLREPGFIDELAALIRGHAIPPGQLTIEITERVFVGGDVAVQRAAHALVHLGVGLSMDDFGTGYASMHQLRAFPLTEVKIDRSYVHGLLDHSAEMAIVTTVHELARALGLDLVAEGVEDEDTAAVLARLPGTIGQGWHFGHPMPAEELEHWQSRR
ncbi:MAG TPA: EAL domain-containing protein [Micromonosporaceae bacterium]